MQILAQKKGGGAHLCPLSVGLYHEYDTGVWLIQRVSVQQSLARHTKLYFGDAGCWTTEAGRRGGGLLNVIHPGSGWGELPTSKAVRCEAVGRSKGWESVVAGWWISGEMWHAHRRQALLTLERCHRKNRDSCWIPGNQTRPTVLLLPVRAVAHGEHIISSQ